MRKQLNSFFLFFLIFPIIFSGCRVEVVEGDSKGEKMGKYYNIGVVRVYGTISYSVSTGWFGSDSSSVVEKAIKQIERYTEDQRIKGVIIRVNSPGGTIAGSQAIYEAVKRLKEKKPVVVYMEDIATSGAYYISCVANKIVALPGTTTASIGVIISSPNYTDLFKKIGIKLYTIKSGKFKDILSPGREMTGEEYEYLKSLVMQAYEQFLKAVSEGRNIPIEELKKIADGRIMLAEEAIKYRLIDALGDFETAKELMAQLLNTKKEFLRLEEPKEKKGLLAQILGLETSAITTEENILLQLLKQSGYLGLFYLPQQIIFPR